MDKQNSLKVSILGKQYSLVTDENEHVVARAGLLVDALMKNIASKTTLTTANEAKIAVLAALQIATDLTKQLDEKDASSERIQHLIEHLDREL